MRFRSILEATTASRMRIAASKRLWKNPVTEKSRRIRVVNATGAATMAVGSMRLVLTEAKLKAVRPHSRALCTVSSEAIEAKVQKAIAMIAGTIKKVLCGP